MLLRSLAPRHFLPWRFLTSRALFSSFNLQQFQHNLDFSRRLLAQSKEKQALKFLTQLRQEANTNLGQKNKYWPMLQSQIGIALYNLNRYQESFQVLKELCEHFDSFDFSSLSDQQKLPIAYFWIPYGLTLFQLNQIDKAIEATQKGLKQMQEAYGENHIKTVEEYRNFAYVLRHFKRFDLSVQYFQKYIDNYSMIENPNDIKVKVAKIHLGTDICNLGRREEAMEIFNEIIKTCNPAIQQEQKLIQQTKMVLAVKVLEPLNRIEEAFKIYEQVHSELDPNLNHTFFNVRVKCIYGTTLSKQGRNDEAFTVLKEAIDLVKKHNFNHNIECLAAKERYGAILQKLGYVDQGIEHKRQVNKDSLKLVSEDSEIFLQNEVDLVVDLFNAQKYDEAEQRLKYRKEYLEKKGKRATSIYCKIMINMCAVLLSSGKFDEGMTILKEFKQITEENDELKMSYGPIVDEMSQKVHQIRNK